VPETSPDMTHPEDQVAASYLDGSLPAAARDRYEAHLAACEECRAGIALLAAAATLEADPEAESVPPEFVARARQARQPLGALSSRGRGGLAAAAALVAAFVGLAAMMFVILPRSEPSKPPVGGEVYRGENDSPFGELRPLAGSVVPADALVFYWTPVPTADRYVVSVANASGATLAAIEAPGSASSVVWPSALEPPAGGRFTWRIKALALDRLVAESKPIPFEVR